MFPELKFAEGAESYVPSGKSSWKPSRIQSARVSEPMFPPSCWLSRLRSPRHLRRRRRLSCAG